MPQAPELSFTSIDGARFTLKSPRLIIAGYTGRDEASVRAHIDELAAIGIPPPDAVPMFYPLPSHLLTTKRIIEVDGANTSGEAEPVVIVHEGNFFLGIGSDHTDRDMERDSVAASKAACPKPVGSTVMPMPRDPAAWTWDAIGVASVVDGQRYQSGQLSAIRKPDDILKRLRDGPGIPDGDWAMFMGTVPLLSGNFIPGARWEIGLTFSDGRRLAHTYEAHIGGSDA